MPKKGDRAIYISGLGDSPGSVERVANVLAPTNPYENHYFQDVDAYTLSQAFKNPDILRRAAKDASAIVTRSAGLVAAEEAIKWSEMPPEINAFSPPIHTRVLSLIGRTVSKTYNMHSDQIDQKVVRDYERSSAVEIGAHFSTYIKHLPAISRFDALTEARNGKMSGLKKHRNLDITLAWPLGDEYYQPPPDRIKLAEALGIRVLILPQGSHDQLVLHPKETLNEFMQAKVATPTSVHRSLFLALHSHTVY